MKRIRLVIAGCGGGRGMWFAGKAAKHDDFEVVALVDALPAAAEVVAEHIGAPQAPVFADVAEALDAVDADAVLVATPDGEHVGPVLAALARGKRVFVEKPLAITLGDCLSIVRADREAGGLTMVGFNLRFAPLYARVNRMVREGAVGEVLTIQADEFYDGGRTYFRRWNRLRKCGGGLWITKASHDFDLLYWMAGKLPTRVSAAVELSFYKPRRDAGQRCSACAIEPECPDSAWRYLKDPEPPMDRIMKIREEAGWYPDLCLFNSDKDTFDHGTALLQFGDDTIASYTVNVVAAYSDRTMRIAGTKGALYGALGSNDLLRWERYGEAKPESIPLVEGEVEGGHGGGDSFLLSDFAAFVRGKPARVTTPAEASVAIAIGLAATQASDTGRTVLMDQVPGWCKLVTTLQAGG